MERKRVELPPGESPLGGLEPDGGFSGYASLFGTVDLSSDRVERGAFARSLAERGVGGIRMLYQHDPNEPIGAWTTIREDERGLFVRGKLAQGVKRAREVLDLMRSGALDGLSIGFRTIRATREGGHRKLWQVDLFEISIVTFPMMEDARIAPSGYSTGAAIVAATNTIRNR